MAAIGPLDKLSSGRPEIALLGVRSSPTVTDGKHFETIANHGPAASVCAARRLPVCGVEPLRRRRPATARSRGHIDRADAADYRAGDRADLAVRLALSAIQHRGALRA